MDRIDGNAIWHGLNWADKNVIGGIAVELAVALWARDTDRHGLQLPLPVDRAMEMARWRLAEMLVEHVSDVLRERLAPGKPVPVPAIIGPVCRVCGCSEHDACQTAAGPCSWAEPDLCSGCIVIPLPPPATPEAAP